MRCKAIAVADATLGLKATAQYLTKGGAHEGPMEVIRYLLQQNTSTV